MPHILTPLEFAAHLGLTEVTPQALTALESAEALFELATGRTAAPFGIGIPGRTEVHNGSGSDQLFLDYPIAALTSVKLGYDVNNPVESLEVADQTVLNWAVGSTRLQRIGGRFGNHDQSRYVHVTYNTQIDIPAAVRAAIFAGGSLLYQTRGNEALSAERIGAYSVDYKPSVLKDLLDSIPAWSDAVHAYGRDQVAP